MIFANANLILSAVSFASPPIPRIPHSVAVIYRAMRTLIVTNGLPPLNTITVVLSLPLRHFSCPSLILREWVENHLSKTMYEIPMVMVSSWLFFSNAKPFFIARLEMRTDVEQKNAFMGFTWLSLFIDRWALLRKFISWSTFHFKFKSILIGQSENCTSASSDCNGFFYHSFGHRGMSLK